MRAHIKKFNSIRSVDFVFPTLSSLKTGKSISPAISISPYHLDTNETENSHSSRTQKHIELHFPAGKPNSDEKLTRLYTAYMNPSIQGKRQKPVRKSQVITAASSEISAALQDKLDLDLQFAESKIELGRLKQRRKKLIEQSIIASRMVKRLDNITRENEELRRGLRNSKIEAAMKRFTKVIGSLIGE